MLLVYKLGIVEIFDYYRRPLNARATNTRAARLWQVHPIFQDDI